MYYIRCAECSTGSVMVTNRDGILRIECLSCDAMFDRYGNLIH